MVSTQRHSYTIPPPIDLPIPRLQQTTGHWGRAQIKITLLPALRALYSHSLSFPADCVLCCAVVRHGRGNPCPKSHLTAVHSVYGSFGLPLRRFIAVADRHEASGSSFPVRRSRWQSHGWYLERHRVGKLSAVESVGYLCLGTICELSGNFGWEGVERKPVSHQATVPFTGPLRGR